MYVYRPQEGFARLYLYIRSLILLERTQWHVTLSPGHYFGGIKIIIYVDATKTIHTARDVGNLADLKEKKKKKRG